MTLFVLSSLFAIGIQSSADSLTGASNPDIERELKALRQEFFEAQRRGDRAVLERFLAPGFVFTHSTGRVEERSQYIERMTAAARPAATPELEFLEDRIRVYGGHTAVWTTRSVRRGGPAGAIEFRSTDVLVKSGEQWQWASVHSTRLGQ